MNAFPTNLLILAGGCFSGAEVAGWSLEPAVLLPLLLGGLLYASGLMRLWRRAGTGHGVGRGQAVAFALGWTALGVALMSPLHETSRQFFGAHMIEHELVMAVAAPLLVYGRPLGVLAWSLPRAMRRGTARVAAAIAYLCGWDIWTRAVPATLLHAAAIWAWHVPVLFDAALTNEAMHWLQHASFLISGLFFWWSVFAARREGLAVAELFFTGLHTGALGVVLALAPRPLYAAQAALSQAGGVDPLADQQMAGLIMWVPAGFIYVGVALWLAQRWISQSSREAAHVAAS